MRTSHMFINSRLPYSHTENMLHQWKWTNSNNKQQGWISQAQYWVTEAAECWQCSISSGSWICRCVHFVKILQMYTYNSCIFCLCALYVNAKVYFKKQASKVFKNANIIKDKKGCGIVLRQRRRLRSDNLNAINNPWLEPVWKEEKL